MSKIKETSWFVVCVTEANDTFHFSNKIVEKEHPLVWFARLKKHVEINKLYGEDREIFLLFYSQVTEDVLNDVPL